MKKKKESGGFEEGMLKLVRTLPKVLKYLPSDKAQDARNFMNSLQYWLGGSSDNLENFLLMISKAYVPALSEMEMEIAEPETFPETGIWHPTAPAMYEDLKEYLNWYDTRKDMTFAKDAPVVGLVLQRSHLVTGDEGHYSGMVMELEAKGAKVVPIFAGGLDFSVPVEKFFFDPITKDAYVDTVLSLTGFALVGGPARQDHPKAIDSLKKLNVPYMVTVPLSFQTTEEWTDSTLGLHPRPGGAPGCAPRARRRPRARHLLRPRLQDWQVPLSPGPRRADRHPRPQVGCAPQEEERRQEARDHCLLLPPRQGQRRHRRVPQRVRLHLPRPSGPQEGGLQRRQLARHRGGAHQLRAQRQGGQVRVPRSQHRAQDVCEGVREALHLPGGPPRELGPPPGNLNSDGQNLLVYGKKFGNVFIGVQPTFGYEGDPMRLLFSKSASPHHGFAAYYTYIQKVFGADAVLHFGTHGSLEFMPGKQVGMSDNCYPDLLIGDTPNIYYYAANNPSEATIAKRRSYANTISYLTPLRRTPVSTRVSRSSRS